MVRYSWACGRTLFHDVTAIVEKECATIGRCSRCVKKKRTWGSGRGVKIRCAEARVVSTLNLRLRQRGACISQIPYCGIAILSLFAGAEPTRRQASFLCLRRALSYTDDLQHTLVIDGLFHVKHSGGHAGAGFWSLVSGSWFLVSGSIPEFLNVSIP